MHTQVFFVKFIYLQKIAANIFGQGNYRIIKLKFIKIEK